MSTPELRTPSWLTAMVDQRLALMVSTLEAFGDPSKTLDEYTLLMNPLTEPREGATDAEIERWERTCDNCGKHCPDDVPFYCGTTTRERWGTQVMFTFGTCARCKELP